LSDQLKRASIKLVAEMAGVSIATVSRCLNEPERVRESTRRRVQQAIESTGYSPNRLAQSFRRGRTNRIMVVLPSIGDPFFRGVLDGIHAVTDRRGYSIIITEAGTSERDADEIGAILVSRETDGVILLASVFPYGREVLARVMGKGQPVVIGCETIAPELKGLPSVHVDNVGAARQATRYLVGQGHRCIAFIGGQSDSLLTKDREAGYRTAMQEAALVIDPEWIQAGEMSIAGARQATRRLLDLKVRPSAIFCANDEMAIACMRQLADEGLRVPQDMSVMGFDDTRYAEISQPALSTVAQPAKEIGRSVARRLFRAMEGLGTEGDEQEIVPHRLVLRDSAGPAPASQRCIERACE
jgi:LacI family repressor for deo operon, udp, cdd, tsx, nupC, and nupG